MEANVGMTARSTSMTSSRSRQLVSDRIHMTVLLTNLVEGIRRWAADQLGRGKVMRVPRP